MLPTTTVEDQLGHGTVKNPATMANLVEAIPADSKIKLLLSLSALYFSAETNCKSTINVERIQLVEAGAEVADYFYDYV